MVQDFFLFNMGTRKSTSAGSNQKSSLGIRSPTVAVPLCTAGREPPRVLRGSWRIRDIVGGGFQDRASLMVLRAHPLLLLHAPEKKRCLEAK